MPDIEVETTHGKFRLHLLRSTSGTWLILFSHLGDFTPVCTTELGMMAKYAEKFEEMGAKLLGLSCDDLDSHHEWVKDIEAYNVCKPNPSYLSMIFAVSALRNKTCTKDECSNFQVLLKHDNNNDAEWSQSEVPEDPKRELIKQLNMVGKDAQGNQLPSRALHIVGLDNKVKLSFLYPGSTGRNLDEVLRVLDSLNKASKHKVASPANWKPGDPVVIAPSVSSEYAKELFPQGYNSTDLLSRKNYLRLTAVLPLYTYTHGKLVFSPKLQLVLASFPGSSLVLPRVVSV